MHVTLSTELYYAVLTALFTGVLWVPIIVNRIAEMGLWTALRNPQPDLRPHADWAYRLSHAHSNAIENLAVFAPLAIAIQILGLSSPMTAILAAAYFVARVAHAIIYTLGVPLLRTIAFFVGFLAQVALALHILGAV